MPFFRENTKNKLKIYSFTKYIRYFYLLHVRMTYRESLAVNETESDRERPFYLNVTYAIRRCDVVTADSWQLTVEIESETVDFIWLSILFVTQMTSNHCCVVEPCDVGVRVCVFYICTQLMCVFVWSLIISRDLFWERIGRRTHYWL